MTVPNDAALRALNDIDDSLEKIQHVWRWIFILDLDDALNDDRDARALLEWAFIVDDLMKKIVAGHETALATLAAADRAIKAGGKKL